LERENDELQHNVAETRNRYESALSERDKQIRSLQLNSDECVKNLTIVQNENSKLRNENGQLRQEIQNLTMNLNNRLINEVEDEDIAQEIDRVKDPSSFGALRAILTKMNRLKIELTNMRAQLVESTKRTKELEQKSDNYLTKNKNIAGEIVALKSKVSQLQSQNEFLLNEVEYSQRKVEKQKSQGEVLVARGAPPQPDAYYSHLVRQICQILRIKEEETLIDSIKTIETAYQFLPSLQDTVETIFKIVVEGNIFETPINSYDVIFTTNFLGPCRGCRELVYES